MGLKDWESVDVESNVAGIVVMLADKRENKERRHKREMKGKSCLWPRWLCDHNSQECTVVGRACQ